METASTVCTELRPIEGESGHGMFGYPSLSPSISLSRPSELFSLRLHSLGRNVCPHIASRSL